VEVKRIEGLRRKRRRRKKEEEGGGGGRRRKDREKDREKEDEKMVAVGGGDGGIGGCDKTLSTQKSCIQHTYTYYLRYYRVSSALGVRNRPR
jgi:hypothetical protein